MKLKRFNQLNEGKFDDFIEEVKKVVNYDESEYEQGDEPSNVDLLSEVGELMNKYNLTTTDLQEIVDENPDNWEIQTFVAPQLDYDTKNDKTKDIQDICDDCCDDIVVNNEYIRRVFQWLIDNDYTIQKTK